MQVRILMLGWEFPPYISGGLGTACHGLVRAMGRLDAETAFVLPRTTGGHQHLPDRIKRPRESKNVVVRRVPAALPNPYANPAEAANWVEATPAKTSDPRTSVRPTDPGERVHVIGAGAEGGYDGDLHTKIHRYAERCSDVARDLAFDVIHAHDWMTYPAGMAIARATGRPLVVHVHATEFDRSGQLVHQPTYDIERGGMNAATRVIAVSHFTARIVTQRYGIPEDKVDVVHNGIDVTNTVVPPRARRPEKTVLFLGRITRQKGPEFFVRAAARVAERVSNVRFMVAGWGDLGPSMIEQACAAGLGPTMRFTGFLRGEDVDRAYQASDVYVMPSVSEPFGLTALEAARHGVPVVLSKTSGVAEVLRDGALAVDYWDVDRMATQIASILRHPSLESILRTRAAQELRSLTWDDAARRCLDIYERVVEDTSQEAA